MFAVRTKLYPATGRTGKRILARCDRGSLFTPWDESIDDAANHRAALTALVRKLKMHPPHIAMGHLVGGDFEGSTYWAYVDQPPLDRVTITS